MSLTSLNVLLGILTFAVLSAALPQTLSSVSCPTVQCDTPTLCPNGDIPPKPARRCPQATCPDVKLCPGSSVAKPGLAGPTVYCPIVQCDTPTLCPNGNIPPKPASRCPQTTCPDVKLCPGSSVVKPGLAGQTVCKEVNINYPGNDIGRSSRQRSWESCRYQCSFSSGCTHWKFRNSDGECWLKTGISQKTNENGLVSGAGKCSGGNCQCNGITRFDTRTNKQVGNCNSQWQGSFWCYISDASQCGDKKGTKRNENGKRYYSYAACESQTQFQRDTFQIEEQVDELLDAQFDPLLPEAQVEVGEFEESP